MQSQILVPLDGSVRAEGILPYVLPLARATGSALTLMQIVPTLRVVEPLAGVPVPADAITERIDADEDLACHYLDAIAARLTGAGYTVRTEVAEGDPATALIEYAAAHPAVTLIALVTHGRTGLRRWVFGSVAEAVLHATPVPLLLVRALGVPPPEAPEVAYRTIVVPIDGSPFAEQALEQAHALATATGATLVLTTAVEDLDAVAATTGQAPAPVVAARRAEATALANYLETTAARLKAVGLKVDTRLVSGPPAETILHTSDSVGADLIVMATHGRTGFQRLRLGSVALKVVQGTARPVFLLRTRPTAK